MSHTWVIDPTHTSVGFAVRHLGFATVRGNFKTVSGTIQADEAGQVNAIEVEIDAASIETGVADRDAHLRSPDFFDADSHPKVVFRSREVIRQGDGEYQVVGDLTMHGVTKTVTLDAEAGPAIKDPWGLTRRSATVTGKLNRKEWGLTWNQVIEAGALLVSEEVKLSIDVQATLQA